MKPTRRPSWTDSFWNIGNSARQGPHHDDHLFTTTGCPFSDASRALKALVPPFSSWPAWACSEPSAAGDPASSFLLTAALGAALSGPDEQPDTSASHATAAAMQRFTAT